MCYCNLFSFFWNVWNVDVGLFFEELFFFVIVVFFFLWVIVVVCVLLNIILLLCLWLMLVFGVGFFGFLLVFFFKIFFWRSCCYFLVMLSEDVGIFIFFGVIFEIVLLFNWCLLFVNVRKVFIIGCGVASVSSFVVASLDVFAFVLLVVFGVFIVLEFVFLNFVVFGL